MKEQQSVTEAEVLEAGGVTLDALKFRLAAQVAPWGWRRPLLGLATALDGGQPLEQAIPQMSGSRELRCLLQESLELPDPADFMLHALRARAEVRESWRAFVSLVAYPVVLLLFATMVGASFSFFVRGLVDFSEMEDFGLTGFEAVIANIDDQHAALMGVAVIVIWLLVVMSSIALIGPPWAWTAVVGGFVIVGRPLRWVALQEVLHRFHLFAEQGVIDSRIGHAVARSFNRSSQSVVAESIARRIDAGMSIGQSLANCMLSDGLCRPALLLLDNQVGEPAQAFLRSARLLGSLAEQRCRVMGMVVPVFLLAIVGTILWATISCYIMVFIPLVSLISALG